MPCRTGASLTLTNQKLLPGKLPSRLLASLLSESASPTPEVLLGPRIGEDACVIKLPAGALVAASDPITLTGSDVGAHAVLINANDVAVTGVRPRWFLAVVLLPTGTEEETLRQIFIGMRRELDSLGAVLVGGHTEVTDVVKQPVVVGQMLGHRDDGQFLPTGGLRPGDVVLQIGEAPIEGSAIAAGALLDRLASLPEEVIDAARGALRDPGISVVEAALLCSDLGARALHDPTEGGLSAGLYELAEASGVAIEGVDPASIPWFAAGLEICRELGIDPWGTLASGALLAGFPASEAESALAAFAQRGIPAQQVGIAREGTGVRLSSGEPLARYERDELSRLLAG